MTPSEEMKLYLSDRAEWARLVAPRWVAIMEGESPEDRRKTWRIAGPELRAEIRRLKGQDHAISV